MNINLDLTKKQSIAWKYLTDDKTNIICYGGSAGGGKTYLGALWIITLCLKYKGIRTLVGRTVLTQLRLTTLNTIFEVLNLMGLKSDEHYNYNGQSNIIKFYNGSEIILKDLQYNPSDPNMDSLGSLEITAAFVDESSQISSLAYNIIKSRIRYKLNEFNLIPKVLLTLNPSNNWVKKDFYLPFVQGTLDENKQFIQALPTDNPHLPASYIEMLNELPPQQRKRLLLGDWDYLDESDNLFNFNSISDSVFKFSPNPLDKKYMTVDVARFGSDRSVIFIWVGLVILECHVYTKLSTTQLSDEIRGLMRSHGIHPNNIIVDTDGVGAGVGDQIRGTNFVNNSSPLFNQNFTNLKSQCYVKLSELFNEGKISINLIEPSLIDDLTQELLSIKLKNLDKDQKIGVNSKEEMKRVLGRSTDLADSMMMRMYYELKNNQTTKRYAISYI